MCMSNSQFGRTSAPHNKMKSHWTCHWCSLSLSVGFSILDEAVDVARSTPQKTHYHADFITLLFTLLIIYFGIMTTTTRRPTRVKTGKRAIFKKGKCKCEKRRWERWDDELQTFLQNNDGNRKLIPVFGDPHWDSRVFLWPRMGIWSTLLEEEITLGSTPRRLVSYQPCSQSLLRVRTISSSLICLHA